jgi:hypothetical protein
MGMDDQKGLSFGARFSLAMRVLFNSQFAEEVSTALKRPAPATTPQPAPAPKVQRTMPNALFTFAALQREGRLIDFLQQDVAAFSDDEVGAAARVVHNGCRKVLQQYISLEPALKDAEGASVRVPPNFDAQRIRLTGNVSGQPPYQGTLKHHGWVVTEEKFPTVDASIDSKVLAPAEVELA